jgi:CRISPR-associated protein Cst1
MANYNSFFLSKRTGDPFLDTGAIVINEMQKPEEPLLALIERATRIYVEDWNANLHAFFLNSTITQPSFKNDRKIAETIAYFRRLLTDEEPYELGYCRFLGEKTKLFRAGRDNHVLSGSGTFVNFNHGMESGLRVSKEVIIRTFFLPLGTVLLSDKMAIIGCNNPEVEGWFVRFNYREVQKQIGQRMTDGVAKSNYNNPANALFEFIKDMLLKYKERLKKDESIEINLFHFTNFGAKPNIELHRFSTSLFSFYRTVMQRPYSDDWERFVRDHYSNSKLKGAIYNPVANQYELESKSEKVIFDHSAYRTWFNRVYLVLLKEESILHFFLSWSRKQYALQKPFSLFHIVELYQIELKNMKKATLDKVREIADYIVSDDAKLKKRLNTLRLNVQKMPELRRFLISLIADYQQKNQPQKSLITLQEYVEDLFPDGAWGLEIRDLLLIAIYEKLCEQNKEVELEDGEESLIVGDEPN